MNIVDKDKQIQLKVEDIIEDLGAEAIELKIHSSGGKSILRCMVDLPEGGITLGRCADINKKVVAYLENGNETGSEYTVEVNSPGLDRKLYNLKDFLKVKGRNVSLWLSEPVEGKEYLEGRVLTVDGSKLFLDYKDKSIEINFNKIKVGKERI